jgi:hypothetical protein
MLLGPVFMARLSEPVLPVNDPPHRALYATQLWALRWHPATSKLFGSAHNCRILLYFLHLPLRKASVTLCWLLRCSLIAERVLTHGDIGTPRSQLLSEFAPVRHCFEVKDEFWWHGGSVNCKATQQFGQKESSTCLKVCHLPSRHTQSGMPHYVRLPVSLLACQNTMSILQQHPKQDAMLCRLELVLPSDGWSHSQSRSCSCMGTVYFGAAFLPTKTA